MQLAIFNPSHYLDFHTHGIRNPKDPNFVEIVSVHLGQDKDFTHYTIGMHPWWTQSVLTQDQKEKLSFHLKHPNCLALGEVGLDKLKGPAMKLQIEILKNQLTVAGQLKKPVVIHCVRAIDQLLSVKKNFPHIGNWCLHGYSRHAQLAKQLIDQGFYLSIMPGLPDHKLESLLRTIPLDKLFLETDSFPHLSIEQIYLQVASKLDLSVDRLKQQMMQNAKEFFSRE